GGIRSSARIVVFTCRDKMEICRRRFFELELHDTLRPMLPNCPASPRRRRMVSTSTNISESGTSPATSTSYMTAIGAPARGDAGGVSSLTACAGDALGDGRRAG